VNLRSFCPFSLADVVAYGKYDQPHTTAPPAKQLTATRPAGRGRQLSNIPGRDAGLSDRACDDPYTCTMQQETQQMSAEQETSIDSRWRSPTLLNWGKFYPPSNIMLLSAEIIIIH